MGNYFKSLNDLKIQCGVEMREDADKLISEAEEKRLKNSKR